MGSMLSEGLEAIFRTKFFCLTQFEKQNKLSSRKITKVLIISLSIRQFAKQVEYGTQDTF